MTRYQPNWQSLNQQAAQYIASSPLTPEVAEVTPQNGYVRAGLFASLTDVLNDAGPGPFAGGLVIAVDTLQLPEGETKIAAAGVEIVARSIQTLGAAPATLIVAGGPLEIITSGIDGALQASLADAHGERLAGPVALQVDPNAPLPQVLELTPAAPDKLARTSELAVVADGLHSPWSVLALSLTLDAAATIVEQTGGVDLAGDLLRWVTAGAYGLLNQRAQYPNLDVANLASLQSTGVSLLAFTQAAASGATYVPALSADRYKDEVNGLLGVAGTYDQKIGQLEQQEQTEKLLAEFATTLGDINQAAETPLFNTLARLANQTGAVRSELLNAFTQLQQISATLSPLQEALQKAIEDEQQAQLLKTALTTFFDVLTLYVGAAAAVVGAPEALAGDAAKQLKLALDLTSQLLKGGIAYVNKTIAAGNAALGGDISASNSEAAKQGAQAMLGSMATFGEALASLWSVVDDAIAGGQGKIDFSPPVVAKVEKLPDLSGLSVGGLDPTAYWDASVIRLQTALRPLQKGATAGPANAYLEAMQLTATYGKSVGDLQSKLLDLYTQGVAAFDRLLAIHKAEARWNALQAQLNSDKAKAEAAIGLLQRGYISVKRNLTLAVNHYRAAFYYQWLQESDVVVDPSMDYLQLQRAVESSITSLNRVLQGAANGTVRPAQTVTGLCYQIRRDANPLFREVNGKGQALWSIPLSSNALSDKINGNTALFLTEATFELKGAEQTGEVELQIETSGHYENQIGQRTFRFVTQPVSMDSDYEPTTPPKYLVKWKFADAAAYLKPTPYTQWKLTVDKGDWRQVTSIKMTLDGLYLQNP